ncbi:MAG TPA: UDP-glucose 4-epimerase GalE [Dehalococcoidia bacterium]|nr:UDP-glucose 4-epimerase GalE [Dehalococcoidia bacterium]
MNILVTGAAGYIGSIVVQELIKERHSVVALDNLKHGHREAVSPEAPFIQAEIGGAERLGQVFKDNKLEAVAHLAAEVQVEESMSAPEKYFRTNLICGMNLLDTMLRYNVNKLVFSSTAAVYGNPDSIPIEESHPTMPINPYGESKLMFEKVLDWYGYAYGLKFISLRYFNAAGASDRLGEDHDPETHLIPNVLKVALGQCQHVVVFGTDHPTSDGTCIRDYIHVSDIARAHILALKHLERSQANKAYNLGNGRGYSVFEVIETARKVTGISIPVVNRPRRPGDPPVLVASSELAKSELGWEPEYRELETIIDSAWRWQKEHTHGYRE